MPLIAVAEGIFMIVIEFFSDIIFEVFVKGAGYLILRYVFQIGRRKKLDPDGAGVIITGIVFWLLAGICGYILWKYL